MDGGGKKSKPKKKGFSIFPWDWSDKPEKRPPPKAATTKDIIKTATVASRSSRTKPTGANLPPQPAPRSRRPGLSLSPPRARPSESTKTKPPSSPVQRPPTAPSPSHSSSTRSSTKPPVHSSGAAEKVVMRDGAAKRTTAAGGLKRAQVVSQPTAVPVAAPKGPEVDRPRGGTALCLTVRGSWDTETTDIVSKESANLTFEGAVLALIRLRRIESQLHRTRDRFVKELELFRGWNDERYVYVLEQIAKSNQQMDELDPLIASLEAFIREQQTVPFFVPEQQVLRYPVGPGVTQRPPPSQRPAVAGDSVERELDELRRQIRELQLERDYWKTAAPVYEPVGRVEDTVSARSWKLDKYQTDTARRGDPQPQTAPMTNKGNAVRTRSASESREKLTSSSKPPHAAPRPLPSEPAPPSHSGSSGSSSSTSDEVSVDEPFMSRYEDFNASPEAMPTDLEHSLTKLQEIMTELEGKPERRPCPNLNCFASDRDSPEETLKVTYHYSSPEPAAKSARRRRHHTISSAAGKDILAAVRQAAEDNPYAYPRLDGYTPQEISYDRQLRLDSPEKIYIPERYTDFEDEQEDPAARRDRRMRAENIRRMLATPAPGESDREVRDRAKVLLMTPILAREVTERSRRFARQASKHRAL